jgi:hypothetical protein
MSEMHEDDVRHILNYLGVNRVPDVVEDEYEFRLRAARARNSTVNMLGMWPVVDMMRDLRLDPAPPKRVAREDIRWADVRVGLPVVASSPETGTVKGLFQGVIGQGEIVIRSPSSPTPFLIYAKYVRPATEEDDMSCLDEFEKAEEVVNTDPDFEEVEYSDTPEPHSDPVDLAEDVEEEDSELDDGEITSADIGSRIVLDDGEIEGEGVLVSLDGSNAMVMLDGEETETQCDIEDVFLAEPKAEDDDSDESLIEEETTA